LQWTTLTVSIIISSFLCVGTIYLYDSALDNLPAEVQHLLVEIKHKETKSQGKEHTSIVFPNFWS